MTIQKIQSLQKDFSLTKTEDIHLENLEIEQEDGESDAHYKMRSQNIQSLMKIEKFSN